MTELLTSAQMRGIEAAAIASGKVTGLALMERAGQGVVQAVFEEWPDLGKSAHRAVVLCGPGNNGGDGFVVARLLKNLGWRVEVFFYGEEEKMPPDARTNYARWREMGEVRPFGALRDEPWRSDLNVDALFGTGLGRQLAGPLADLARAWRQGRPLGHDLAIDAPSGLCLDSGRVLGHAIPAELSVTFHRRKLGQVLNDGPEYCGKLVVKDIGLSQAPEAADVAHAVTVDQQKIEAAVKASGHKYSHGHAFILSGPCGRGGAARLAARGALRIGAGLVTLGCPPEALGENAARLDAVMLRELADAGALAAVLADQRINALCLGPGMGTGPREAGLVAAALVAGRPAVLDAAALTILAGAPDLFAALHDRCVLTPHAGEFARLFPDLAERLAAPAVKGPAYSKVDATREAAARAGCVVLFKGPDTVIAAPDGSAAINAALYDRAAPWLATAGSGDVLAGFITGLLARGFAPFDAACTGAWLHVEVALEFGPGLIAEDLPEQLPAVFRRLLTEKGRP